MGTSVGVVTSFSAKDIVGQTAVISVVMRSRTAMSRLFIIIGKCLLFWIHRIFGYCRNRNCALGQLRDGITAKLLLEKFCKHSEFVRT